jgi:hypothetical protein
MASNLSKINSPVFGCAFFRAFSSIVGVRINDGVRIVSLKVNKCK